MNRTEFTETLEQLYHDLEDKGGIFQATFPTEGKDMEELKKYAAVSLLAVDRYYSNLTRLMSQRKEL